MSKYSKVRLSFVDLRWAQLYVSLVTKLLHNHPHSSKQHKKVRYYSCTGKLIKKSKLFRIPSPARASWHRHRWSRGGLPRSAGRASSAKIRALVRKQLVSKSVSRQAAGLCVAQRPHNLCLVTSSFCDYLGQETTEQEKRLILLKQKEKNIKLCHHGWDDWTGEQQNTVRTK